MRFDGAKIGRKDLPAKNFQRTSQILQRIGFRKQKGVYTHVHTPFFNELMYLMIIMLSCQIIGAITQGCRTSQRVHSGAQSSSPVKDQLR